MGSQLIASSALKDISSATIRNIMKDLEEEGYLYQPHTSGGRIPTDKAYRYYVDYLTGVQRMAAQERERIEKQYDERVGELDNVMLQTSRLLARLSGAAALYMRETPMTRWCAGWTFCRRARAYFGRAGHRIGHRAPLARASGV